MQEAAFHQTEKKIINHVDSVLLCPGFHHFCILGIDEMEQLKVLKGRNASRLIGLAFCWRDSQISHTRTRFHERTQIKVVFYKNP